MAGTIPTVVDYSIRVLDPNIFLATAVICALVGLVRAAWTTAGTLGVAFVAMAKVMGLERPPAPSSGGLLRRQDDLA
jgi:NhaC family Na+:H+ antiporter